MSPVDRRLRRALDRAGLAAVVAWPVLAVLAAVGAWLYGS